MDIENATEVRDTVLKAIEQLSLALEKSQGQLTEEEEKTFRKAIGMAIVAIDTEILGFLYEKFPDINDLHSKH